MVTRHQMNLKYSIIMDRIVDSYEIDTSWYLSLLKLAILLK